MADRFANLIVCAWGTVSLPAADLFALQDRVRASHPGAALVVSCQRLEAFAIVPCDCDAPERASSHDAVRRLAAVAAGLHSVVLGEDQILAQVRDAFAQTTGELRRAADLAIASARLLRHATDFNSHAGALLDRALRLAEMEASGTLLILGTGQMARLVASRAPALGFTRVVLAGRTEPPAGPWEFAPLAAVQALGDVDVVVGCLGSSAGEFPFANLPGIRSLAVDLGTPRNFDPAAAPVPVVTIAAMLADEATRPHAVRRRAELRDHLDRILAKRLHGDDAALRSIRQNAEAIRQREAARALRLHPELPPEAIEALTRSLVNQLLHTPVDRLRSEDEAFSRAVAALFEPH